ncbi:hypothetical protein L1987_49640 [Smallanthus sonchifolius]|uniref:Uncharacterized protein n=1 Tax=Smallanthus sonchifolius TaxID=185202 RepID=A0ACB9FVB3_9ASTR|nr:hypothetical protein L1987_49640 [Smallanthus sonchifolius]
MPPPHLHQTSAANHHRRRHTHLPPIRAMRTLQGRAICITNDKAVNVEVHPHAYPRVRVFPYPKKKKFLAVQVPKRTALESYSSSQI